MDAKQARKLPHLNFSPQEWFFSTRFHSLEARGLLIDLAAIQWMRGWFPRDRASVERLVGVPVSQAVWDEVTPLFVDVQSGIGLQWVETERREAIQRIERAAESGSKGAKKRYDKGAHSHPIATPKGAHRVPIAILDCTGLDRTEPNRTEPETSQPSVALAPSQVAKPTRSKPKDTIAWSPDSGFVGITAPDRASWEKAYPACNIDRQLAAADQWLRANPTKAVKTLWRKFVTGWFARAQERGGDTRTNGQHYQPKQTIEEKTNALAEILRNAPSRRNPNA